MVLQDSQIAPGPQMRTEVPPRRRFPTRPYALAVYGAALVLWCLEKGLPTDYLVAFGWLWLATIAWNLHRPWHSHLGFVRDWVPIVVVLTIYDFSRGLADNLSLPHVTEMIRADEWLFGTVPTVWLQERFYDPLQVHWYDVVASFVYFSHFVASFTVAVVLWLRARALWAAFMRRWLTLIAAGLTTYFLYPAAPPWWASKYGYLAEEVERTSTRGWSEIGLYSAGKLVDAGQALSNPVAAMPSLHSAFSLSVVAFFFTRVARRWLPLLVAYPVAMTLTLVYTGEHYVIDALVGFAYVGAVYLLVNLAERWWRRPADALTAETLTPLAPAGRG